MFDLMGGFHVRGDVRVKTEVYSLIFPKPADPLQEARHLRELALIQRYRLVRTDLTRNRVPLRRRHQGADEDALLAEPVGKLRLPDRGLIDPLFFLRVIKGPVEKTGSDANSVFIENGARTFHG